MYDEPRVKFSSIFKSRKMRIHIKPNNYYTKDYYYYFFSSDSTPVHLKYLQITQKTVEIF